MNNQAEVQNCINEATILLNQKNEQERKKINETLAKGLFVVVSQYAGFCKSTNNHSGFQCGNYIALKSTHYNREDATLEVLQQENPEEEYLYILPTNKQENKEQKSEEAIPF